MSRCLCFRRHVVLEHGEIAHGYHVAGCWLCSDCARRHCGARATASELLALSTEYGLVANRGVALICLGWNLGQTKDIGEGLRYLEQGLATRIQLGLRSLLPFSICLLAETYFRAQHYAKAVEQVDLALAASSEIGDQWFLPRIHMLHAQLLQEQACPNVDAAEASLRIAIDVARAQCAKGWELRATILLASLWRDQGKRTEARDLLSPIYGWFTEGFANVSGTAVRDRDAPAGDFVPRKNQKPKSDLTINALGPL